MRFGEGRDDSKISLSFWIYNKEKLGIRDGNWGSILDIQDSRVYLLVACFLWLQPPYLGQLFCQRRCYSLFCF